ncbi:MAG TPA: aminotransferase class I/II-fold pyridoxal phosphate-dependent enzyme [Clostridiales bacterium]|nr:aminotransferase class I/II-fold pyridoxal phosphate-dependent enzyme [Clostridiales bacterium]
MGIFQKCADFTKVVDGVKEKGIYPYFHHLESRQDVVVIMEGKRRIMLGSNNYLGLTTHPEVVEAAIKAVEKYGTGCSGSRFLNGTLDLHIQLEEELAEFVGKEAACTFPSGFQTNLGIISSLAGRHDYILIDRENHASIYDGCRLSFGKIIRYKHDDMEDLERCLEKLQPDDGKLIITDGVFSMSGDICSLPKIVELARKYNAAVMVDDAHGFGVLGDGGRGTANHFGLTAETDIIMSTFSKSLASLGGFMAADKYVVEYVKHNSRPFIFAASIPPASCAAALAALRVIKKNPEIVSRLSDLSRYMRNGLKERGIPLRESKYTTPIIPFYTYELETTLIKAKEIYEAGVYLNPVLEPAAPEGKCLLRISLMATHTYELLDEAMDIIDSVINEKSRTVVALK